MINYLSARRTMIAGLILGLAVVLVFFRGEDTRVRVIRVEADTPCLNLTTRQCALKLLDSLSKEERERFLESRTDRELRRAIDRLERNLATGSRPSRKSNRQQRGQNIQPQQEVPKEQSQPQMRDRQENKNQPSSQQQPSRRETETKTTTTTDDTEESSSEPQPEPILETPTVEIPPVVTVPPIEVPEVVEVPEFDVPEIEENPIPCIQTPVTKC